jgi:hypothetical protein
MEPRMKRERLVNKEKQASGAQWYLPVISALRRLKQEDLEFEASLD